MTVYLIAVLGGMIVFWGGVAIALSLLVRSCKAVQGWFNRKCAEKRRKRWEF